MKMEMKRQDMEELFQLLEMYERTYGGRKVTEMLQEVSARYRVEKGEGISQKRNPRGAGRKQRYGEDEKRRIKGLREAGMSIRRIAEGTGCSVGYVQGVLSDLSRRGVQ